MTNMEMLVLLGDVQGKYILQAQEFRSRTAHVRHFSFRRAMVLVAAILALTVLLCGTAMAVSEDFRNYVFDIIGILLPPKTETILIEGLEEEINYASFGEIPSSTNPGFAIYNDYDSYTMTEENGIYYIRPVTIEGVDNSQYPTCEMVIEHSTTDWQNLCTQAREQMRPNWEIMSEVEILNNPERLAFSVQDGMNWDSRVESHYFLSDGKDGAYHITAQYFLEAAEGHGVRFAAMVASFHLLTDQDAVQGQTAAREEVADLAKDFAEAYFNRDTKTIQSFLLEGVPSDTVFSGGKVSDLLVKQIVGVENAELGQTRVVSIEFRETDQPDRLQYLTIELVLQADGWKVVFYGLEG